MTIAQVRPAPPRRATTLLLPLLVTTVAWAIGGLLGEPAAGALWGLVGGAGLIAALRLADVRLDTRDRGVLMAGAIVTSVLATIVLGDLPDRVTPSLAATFGLAWLPLGASTAYAITRHGSRPTKGVNVALSWTLGGALALPAAVSFDVLQPLSSAGRNEILDFSVGIYLFIGVVVGLVGGGATLGAFSEKASIAVAATVIFITAYAGAQVGFTLPGLVRNLGGIGKVPNFWPPDFSWAVGDTGNWWWLPTWEFGSAERASPIIETFRIAISASVLGCGVALPVAFLASKVTTPNTIVYMLDKGFMNLIRTIPDLFWALLFATSVGVGPFAGALALIIFSLAIMAKLLSETVDAVDPRPLEAAMATGSSHFPAVRSSVLPQVLPNYVAYALYIFEINIRASVVLGLVGAGGIGRILETQRSFFRFDRVLAIVIVIFVIVFIIEQVSVALRRRLV